MPESVPTVRRRMLGGELRRLREATGLTMLQAGERLERAESTLSRAENGRVKLHPREVEAMLDVYGVTDHRLRDALVTLARDGRKRGWWNTYKGALDNPYIDLISLEADARAIRTFQNALVPGLLQTEDYARAIITAEPSGEKRRDIDRLVTVRMERQTVLTNESPLQLWAILSEASLQQLVGGREVMRAQLDKLVESAQLDHVTIQVVPFDVGAHAGADGSFVILEFPEPANMQVVHLENMTSSLYLEQDEEIRRYASVFDHLRASALPENHSRALMARIAKEL